MVDQNPDQTQQPNQQFQQQPAQQQPQQQPQQQGYGSYYAQRSYAPSYQTYEQPKPKPEGGGHNMEPVYIGLGLIAVVAIISVALLLFGGNGAERIDPKFATVDPTEEVRILVYCETRCDETRVEDLGGAVLTRFERENAILIVLEGAQIARLGDEPWVKRLASPL